MLTHMGEVSKELKPPTRRMENPSKKKKKIIIISNNMKKTTLRRGEALFASCFLFFVVLVFCKEGKQVEVEVGIYCNIP